MARPAWYEPRRFVFAALTAGATLALIGLGGVVTSKGVGMAVPDWPTTYGYNMFLFPVSLWKGGIFYEHTHRLFASFVGLLTVILAVWISWRDPRRWMKNLGWLACFLVVLQGVLGGLRVVMLQDAIGIFHAALAQLFLVLLSCMALFSSSLWGRLETRTPALRVSGSLRGAFLATTLLIFAQLLLGATMRHQHAGLAVPDFPLAYGSWWPPTDPASLEAINRARLDVRDYGLVTAFQIGLHMAHRLGAILILLSAAVAACLATGRSRPPGWLVRAVWVWLALLCLQGLLGAATVWTNKAADIATAHVVLGAGCLALGGVLVALSWGLPGRVLPEEGDRSGLAVRLATRAAPARLGLTPPCPR